MIFEDAIIEWRNSAPWQDDVQVEQDLILTGVLQIATRNVKIEINTREHRPFDKLEQKPLRLDSLWRKGDAMITTYTLEELLATKLRALYQRRKGRDLFDLWKSKELRPDWQKVVLLFEK